MFSSLKLSYAILRVSLLLPQESSLRSFSEYFLRCLARALFLQICKIVFLTITEDYARLGYSLSASYYLLKPLSSHQADFEEAMELCQLKPPHEVMTLSVMADRQTLKLPTDKILYIDHQNRVTRIHTAERVIPVSGGFQEVTAALQKDKRFLACYRGILINMDHISHVDSQTFRLINGEELPISLRNRKQLREVYRQYVFSGMEGIV